MSGNGPWNKAYGNSRISGRAQATFGDTYNYNIYLGAGPSTLTDDAVLQVTEVQKSLHHAQSLDVFGKTFPLRPSPFVEQNAKLVTEGVTPANSSPPGAANRLGCSWTADAVVAVDALTSMLPIYDLCSRITERLKDFKHDPSLDPFARQVKLLTITIEILRPSLSSSPPNEAEVGIEILEVCLAQVEPLLVEIDKGLATLNPTDNNNPAKRIWQSGKTRATRQRLAALGVELDKWQHTFNLYVSFRLAERSRRHETTTLLPATPTSRMNPISPCCKRPPKSPCEQGLCLCRCHIPLRRPRGLIVAAPAHPLHRCNCQVREVWVNINLAKLQKLLNVRLALDWTKGLTMDWSLSCQNTVRRMNVGRIILEKCAYGKMGFVEAQEEFTRAWTANQLKFADIDPSGDGLLDIAIKYPWGIPHRDLQHQLIRWLVDIGTPVNSERLLQRCLTWLGEGPYAWLLETLLECSLDASDVSPRLLSAWPRASSADWIWSHHSGDPFFLQAVSMLAGNYCEFGGTTRIQFAILRGDYPLVEALLTKNASQVNTDRNFLGHHALHLAISSPKMVGFLLEQCSGICIDITDNGQSTPLMYTMAYGATDAAKLLLMAGADPFRHDKLNGFCAWDYALVCGDHGFFMEVLQYYRLSEPTTKDRAVSYCLWRRMFLDSAQVNDYDCKILKHLLQFKCGHQILAPRDNTLLHLCSCYEAECLLEYGQWPINQRNSHGYTPLMAITRFRQASLVRNLIDQGAMVNVMDDRGCNALHHLNDSLERDFHAIISSDSWLASIETATALLASSISMKQSDSCRCMCSSSGCTPLIYLFSACHWYEPQLRNLSALPWFLEWLVLLSWARPEEISALAAALYRRQRFDELGMTHTCCVHPRRGMYRFGDSKGWVLPTRSLQNVCLIQSDDDEYEEDSNIEEIRSDGADEPEEEESDTEELWDEELFLAQELQEDCDNFSAAVNTDSKTAWVSILARRAAMMEESLAKVKLKQDKDASNLAHQKLRAELEQRDDVEIISVDRKADTIITSYAPLNLQPDLSTKGKLQYHVKEYLEACEARPEYMTKLVEASFNPISLADERRSLVSRLLEEVARLHEAPQAERDWEMRVEES